MDNKKNISNLLADFIMKKLGLDFDTKIQVCICNNFIIVKGETSSKDIMNLSKVLDSFYEKYSNLESTKNIIDLIEYDKKIVSEKSIKLDFTNEKNCSFKLQYNENDYFHLSNFPYGYSLNQNRLIYYYFKKIVYSIPNTYPFSKISFQITNEENKLNFTITDDYINNHEDCLKSAILDVYDFDLLSFENEIKKMDLDVELLNPDDDIEFLKIRNKDFLII